MSIPSYVLNWEELLDIIGDKLQVNIEDIELGDLEDFLKANLDAIIELLNQILELLKNRGTQRVHSISNHIPAVVGVYKFTTTFDYDIFLTGITYSQSGWKYQDSWDLMVGENLLFDEVCTKELGEQKQFNVFYFVPAGTPIDILFHNDSGNSRLAWFDIEYIGLSGNEILSPCSGTIVVNYITEDGELIYTDIINGLGLGLHTIEPDNIPEGYTQVRRTVKL